MSNVAPSSIRIGWAFSVLIYAFIAVGLAYGATDTAIGWMIPLAVVGGALMAAVIMATHSHHAPMLASDSFERGAPSADVMNIMNIARVRVAGVGGVGLMFVAGLVALQYELTTVAMAAGLVGGAIGAFAVIHHRRGHR